MFSQDGQKVIGFVIFIALDFILVHKNVEKELGQYLSILTL